MSNRHRRTRIYGANYNIGESYYKKQLDDLDNKRGYNRENKPSFDSDYNTRDDKAQSKVLFFPTESDDNDDEYSTGFTKKKSILRNAECDRKQNDMFDDLVLSSIKPSYVKAETPLDLEFGKKGALNLKFSSKYKTSSAVKEIATEEASCRVKATKSRLLDLEQEMANITEKQNEREKRNQNLKKMLSLSSNNEKFE